MVIGRFEAKSRREWRAWLEKNHASAAGVWLVFYKSGSPHHLTDDDIAEEALCFGWIDSRPGFVDSARARRYVAPRKPGSAWSNLNKARAERMIRAGLMRPAGRRKIDAAKKDGSWDFLADVQAGVVPRDLKSALAADASARRNFEGFPPSSKRIILEWIKNAKRPETRAARVLETVRLAALGLRANHFRQVKGRAR